MRDPAGAGTKYLHHQLLRQEPSIAFPIRPGRPSVTIEPCCRTRWGTLPDGMNSDNGTPTCLYRRRELCDRVPELRRPDQPLAGLPSGLREPKIGIGVAWPNAKAYRYEVESIPVIDGGDGTCARYSNAAGKVSNWWTYELH